MKKCLPDLIGEDNRELKIQAWHFPQDPLEEKLRGHPPAFDTGIL